jgi:hypothetical protein
VDSTPLLTAIQHGGAHANDADARCFSSALYVKTKRERHAVGLVMGTRKVQKLGYYSASVLISTLDGRRRFRDNRGLIIRSTISSAQSSLAGTLRRLPTVIRER